MSHNDFMMKCACPNSALTIIRTLQEHGHQAVFAGGCVRDMLLGKVPHDWDIATSAKPDEVETLFSRTIPVGKQFGIIVVLIGNESYEVATFRGESTYSDGRHPDEIHFVEAEEDVKRRDFTINALLYDPIAHNIMDFVGGQEDLARGIVRAVGESRRRFEEDKLRVIRAVRFAARLGYEIEPETFAAMREYSSQIPQCVSVERIASETEKMLMDGHAARAFDLLEQAGILASCFPVLQAMKGVEQPPQFHPEGDVWQHTLKVLAQLDQCMTLCTANDAPNENMPPEERFSADGLILQRATESEKRGLCWAVLCHDIGKPTTFYRGKDRIHFNGHDVVGADMTEHFLKSLKLPNDVIDIAVYLVRGHMNQIQMTKARVATRRRILQDPRYPLMIEIVREDALASCGIMDSFHAIHHYWLEEANTPKRPKPTLNGRDLLALGLKPSPLFKTILDEAADLELEHPFANHDEAMQWLKKRYAEMSPQ